MSELKDVTIEEISLVDAGANPEAKVLLYKSKAQGEGILKALIGKVEGKLAEAEAVEMRKVALKYELIENPEELAEELKKYKAAGVYDSAIALLDKVLALESRNYAEIGKSGVGEVTVGKVAAAIRKEKPTLSERAALDLAYQRMGAKA